MMFSRKKMERSFSDRDGNLMVAYFWVVDNRGFPFSPGVYEKVFLWGTSKEKKQLEMIQLWEGAIDHIKRPTKKAKQLHNMLWKI
jgi:hypothetical protein